MASEKFGPHVLSEPVTEKDIEACGGFTEEFFTKLHDRYGKVAKFYTMGFLNTSFADAKAIKACHLKFPIRPDNLFPILNYLGKENLLFRKDPAEIKAIRERYASVIRSPVTMELMHEATIEAFTKALDNWEGKSVNLHAELSVQIYDIMGKIMFGAEWSKGAPGRGVSVGKRIKELHLYCIDQSNRWAYLPDEMKEKEKDYKQYLANIQELRDICGAILDDKRKEMKNNSPKLSPAATGVSATAAGLSRTAKGIEQAARGLADTVPQLGAEGKGMSELAVGLAQTAVGLQEAAKMMTRAVNKTTPPAAAGGANGRADAFTLLLQETNPDGTPFFDREFAISTMIGFLNGAYDTTHSTLHWTLFHLAKFPDVQEKLRKEIFETLGASHPFNLHDARKLDLLHVFTQESQRQKATTPFNMRCNPNQDVEIMSEGQKVVVPKGTSVTTPYFLAYKDETTFGCGAADPMDFCPHRFQGEDNDTVVRNSFLTPFGGGPRMCIGFLLATVEMKAAIITVLRRCTLTLADPVPLPMPTILEAGVLQPVTRFRVHFTRHPRAALCKL